MKNQEYFISKHALERTIERLIMSQNIKLNKKQRAAFEKRASKIIKNNLKYKIATSYSNDGIYEYIYSDINGKNRCRKYVVDIETRQVITIINNINITEEISKYKLYFSGKGGKILKKDKVVLSYYIYVQIYENVFLFVVNQDTNQISSIRKIENC